MNIDEAYRVIGGMLQERQSTEVHLDMSILVRLRQVVDFAATKTLSEFKNYLGEYAQKHLEETDRSLLLAQLRTAVAIRQLQTPV